MKGCLGVLFIIAFAFAALYLALSMLIWVVCTVFGFIFNPLMAFGVLCIAAIISILYKLFK